VLGRRTAQKKAVLTCNSYDYYKNAKLYSLCNFIFRKCAFGTGRFGTGTGTFRIGRNVNMLLRFAFGIDRVIKDRSTVVKNQLFVLQINGVKVRSFTH